MNSINAIKTEGPLLAKVPNTTIKPLPNAGSEAGAFSELLSSLALLEEHSKEAVSGTLLEKLDEALVLLEQLPLDALVPEEQEMLNTLLDFLSFQTGPIKNSLEAKNLGHMKTAESHIEQIDSKTTNQLEIKPIQKEMVEILSQITQKAQTSDSNPVKEFAVGPIFMGVEKEYILNEPKIVKETLKILTDILNKLNNIQEEKGYMVSAKFLEQTGELLKQAEGISGKLELLKLGSENELQEDFLVEIPTEPLTIKQVEGSAAGTSQSSDTSALQPETLKPSHIQPRTESPLPAQTVRIANLAEDLSGVLKSSLKLSGSGESTQIKVSIFPEHLGHLEIRLSTVDGKVAAQIFTSNLFAKEALDLQVYQLRNSLIQQGVSVDRIEISQQETGQSFNQQHDRQEQRFAQQRQNTMKNGYQQYEEEAAVFVRPTSSVRTAMSVDYTI